MNCVQKDIPQIIPLPTTIPKTCSLPLTKHPWPILDLTDVYLGMSPMQKGASYFNVLVRFGRSSKTMAQKKA